MPDGPFDLLLCRNLVFTYFDAARQRALLRRLFDRLRPGGVLVLGQGETLPDGDGPLAPLDPSLPLYRRPPGRCPA
jgi:chemotaxis protein methyltransferase CheR